MSVTVVLAGATVSDVVVHVDPLAELQAFLHGLAFGDHHPRSEDARAALDAAADADEHRARIHDFAPLFGAIRARFLFPMTASADPAPTLEERLEGLRHLPVEVFARLAAVSLVEESRIFGDGDPTRRPDLFLHVLGRVAHPRVNLGRDLLERPDEVRAGLIRMLADEAEARFAAEWERRRPLLQREAAIVRDALREVGPVAIARLSESATLEPDPERVVFEKINRARFGIVPNGLILVPSWYGSPHIFAKHDPAFPSVIQFPVLEEQAERRDRVRLRLQALQDDARIEICRTVMRTPKTTADLAAQLQMTEPQVSRHLRVLREAGLVGRVQQGRYVYYSLNVSILRGLGEDLLAVLHW